MLLQNGAPALVLVGGFLGAGKTSLIIRAAAILHDRGTRVAAITNDQAAGLVDTQWTEHAGIRTAEIDGGCFCCRFSEFVSQAEALLAYSPDIIFAEPVGSCTDLSATVLEPLRAIYGTRFRTAPLTVLVDPARMDSLLDAPSDIGYLFRKQVEEADIVCFTKSDLARNVPQLPGRAACRRISAKTGEGVVAWLDEVLDGNTTVPRHLLDLDYQRYADAEAALGWLNAVIDLRLTDPAAPATVVGPFMDDLDRLLTQSRARIAHLKIFDRCSAGTLKAAICGNGEEPQINGDLAASAANCHVLTVNLRAEAEPETLSSVLDHAMRRWSGQSELVNRRAFRPSPPRPEFRYSGT